MNADGTKIWCYKCWAVGTVTTTRVQGARKFNMETYGYTREPDTVTTNIHWTKGAQEYDDPWEGGKDLPTLCIRCAPPKVTT